MFHNAIRSCLLLAAVFTASLVCCGEQKFPEEMAVTRAKASVFKVFARGDFSLSFPRDIQFSVRNLQGNALAELDAAYERDRKSGTVSASKSRSDYNWEKLAESPEKYLFASFLRETRTLSNQEYGSGSCFAISHEGLFLTNAHVIADPDTAALMRDNGIVLQLFGAPLSDFIARASRAFGAAPSTQQLSLEVLAGVLNWWKPKCRLTGKFHEAAIVLDYLAQPAPRGTGGLSSSRVLTFEELRKSIAEGRSGAGWPGKTDDVNSLLPKPILMPAKVLAAGSEWPREDVAVLQTNFSVSFLSYPLICLPLGDSDNVYSGMRVHALGFPGIAFEKQIMDARAEFQCSCVDGSISNRKTMIGGMEAFETTLGINHGDSGGPQIDKEGNVIAINVAGADDHGQVAAAHSYSIPINVAQKYLMLARRTVLDPGPVTRLWTDGLIAFGAGRHADAKRSFDAIAQMQHGPVREVIRNPLKTSYFDAQHPDTYLYQDWANPYVKEMRACCQKQLQRSSAAQAIAPKSPVGNWRSTTPEITDPYRWKIGNTISQKN